MDYTIPDYTNINFSVDTDSAKKMIDWGVSLHAERKDIRERNTKMYNSYNGIVNTEKLQNITKKAGDQSATPYIPYRIGRNKIKQLLGEFLQIGLKATVFTINPEARKEKYDKYMQKKSLAMLKPQIEKLRQMGANLYPGVNIPDQEELKITDESFKSQNEIIMQIIADYKIEHDKMLLTFLESWKHLILTSEVAGVVERDAYGTDRFREIDPNNAIFLESPGDIFVKRSPIVGEYRPMFKHEIISEFNLDSIQKKKLEELQSINDEGMHSSQAGQQLIPVYSFQFIGKKTVRRKLSKNAQGIEYTKFIDEETYEKDKNKIERDISKGKYKIIDEVDMLTIYKGSRIGNEGDLYVGIEEKANNVVTKDEAGVEHLEFDYVFALFNTVGGYRVPMQEIVHEMELVYNAIRRQLNIEIGKLKGSHAVFDEAFLGTKPVSKILYELGEHGFTTVNSADPAMTSDEREGVIEKVLKQFELGDPQTITILMNLAMDIEQTLDRQLGMNRDRQGLGQSSSTATTNQNNVNASVSMTYDMFFFIQTYINEVIARLLEKVKINWDWLESNNQGLILSDEQYGYLKATRDLSNDSYAAFVTDGKLEFDISRKLEQYFLQDINSGKLRTVDVAEFLTTKSFAQGVRILKKAHAELTKIQQSAEQQKGQSAQQQTAAQIQAETQWREDEQQHDKEITTLKSKLKEQEIITKGNIERGIHSHDKIRDHAKAMEVERVKGYNEKQKENLSEN